jgi:hypothetical protein
MSSRTPPKSSRAAASFMPSCRPGHVIRPQRPRAPSAARRPAGTRAPGRGPRVS